MVVKFSSRGLLMGCFALRAITILSFFGEADVAGHQLYYICCCTLAVSMISFMFNRWVAKNNCEESDDKSEKKPQVPAPKESPYSFQNFCWIALAISVFYYTEFFPTVFTDRRISRNWFNVGCFFIGVNLSIAAFMIVYLSCIRKIHSDLWEQHYPAAIPIATASFAFGSFCVTVGLWPIWTYFTPLILFSMFMGIVIFIAMLPAF